MGDVGNKRQQTVGANPAIAVEVELDRIPEVLSENRAAASSPAVGAPRCWRALLGDDEPPEQDAVRRGCTMFGWTAKR